ncbi:MAG TPA: GIY-YIG nuclease family protein, partial [Polyangiaceae bacterium]|nr:GIY-YIG nuclease family protein [Polyangiaceae bacterium]
MNEADETDEADGTDETDETDGTGETDEAQNPDASSETADLLTAKLDSLPIKPGCYLFIDKAGTVVYVGKAKSLRSRVRSYFQESGSDTRYFIPLLRRIVRDLETVVT